jgi:sulfite oxidase
MIQDRMWAWTQWRAQIAIPPSAGINELQLVCKATDRAYNTQPETPAGIWNVRGLLNTAWHRVTVKIRD